MLNASIDIPKIGAAVARESSPEGRLCAVLFPHG